MRKDALDPQLEGQSQPEYKQLERVNNASITRQQRVNHALTSP